MAKAPLFSNVDPQFLQRAGAYLENRLSEAELPAFEAELRGDGVKQEAFVRLSVTLAGLSEEYGAARSGPATFVSLEDEVSEPAATGDPNDAAILPAMRAEARDEELLVAPPSVFRAAPSPAEKRSRWIGWKPLGLAAAILLTASIVLVIVINRGPSAQFTAMSGAKWNSGGALQLGSQLNAGGLVSLAGGAAEIHFESGASVVVEGPAEFRITGHNTATLNYGKIVAHVPLQAHGFAVTSQSLNVTDLGTEFGMSVTREGTAHVEVFQGTIEVRRPLNAGASAPAQQLAQGAAVTCQPAGDILPAPSGAIAFTRNISEAKSSLQLHATGLGLASGAKDSYWQIVKNSGDPAFRPRPAIVVDPVPDGWVVNDQATSQWISIDRSNSPAPPGIYTFRTQIDLTGFDPRTLDLEARILVDNVINDIRINGKSIKRQYRSDPDQTQYQIVPLQTGFVAGINEVEVDLQHDGGPLGLRVQWEGSAAAAPH